MIDPWLERWQRHPEDGFRDVVVFVSAFAVLFSVAWSFLNFHKRRLVNRGQRSIVDTFTMVLFFVVFSWLISRRVGALEETAFGLKAACILAGSVLVVVGAVVNVMGRHQLGPTWSNQIAIYEGHQLMTRGLFAVVRHPLYASTIWMFLGAGIAFLNWAALAATVLIFVPAMHYRASQEERLLSGAFPNYFEYRQRTGKFFPKLCSTKPHRL